jgi:alpha/beta superfamily hydrolase
MSPLKFYDKVDDETVHGIIGLLNGVLDSDTPEQSNGLTTINHPHPT